jgi:hypothetical protein
MTRARRANANAAASARDSTKGHVENKGKWNGLRGELDAIRCDEVFLN